MPYPSLYHKIRLAFGIPAMLMLATFWATIYVAENHLELISLQHWVESEHTRYSKDYAQIGENARPPNPYEFHTYRANSKRLPDWLPNHEQVGFYGHPHDGDTKHYLVAKDPRNDGLMYIIFKADADDYLDDYEAKLHRVSIVLGGLLTTLLFAYCLYVIRTLSAPLKSIEEKIADMAPSRPTIAIESQFRETRAIEEALNDSKQTIEQYFLREQEFGRFASHELRTPMTVIQGSTDVLKRLPQPSVLTTKALNRIEVATEEMKVLTDTFLLLGKQDIEASFFQTVVLDQHIIDLVDKITPFAKQKGLSIETIMSPTRIVAPPSFVTIAINNLLKNAVDYGESNIQIRGDGQSLQISNDIVNQQEAGFGCGLLIVERICERLGWQVSANVTANCYITTIEFSGNSVTHCVKEATNTA